MHPQVQYRKEIKKRMLVIRFPYFEIWSKTKTMKLIRESTTNFAVSQRYRNHLRRLSYQHLPHAKCHNSKNIKLNDLHI